MVLVELWSCGEKHLAERLSLGSSCVLPGAGAHTLKPRLPVAKINPNKTT